MVGTPRYMAPEQVTGDAVDARTRPVRRRAPSCSRCWPGRPAFAGRNVVEVLHATLYEQPPALTGSPAVAAADRVIRRALAKRPAERPASADAMAEELRGVRGVAGDDTPALARALTRLVVLPFRVLRPDPETDFLAFSLPDAIATSLSGIGSLVVRSSADRRPLRRRGAGPEGAGRGGRRRPRGDGHAAARRATSCAPRPSSSRRRAGRCSRRTPCSRRWATCSGCRTTSRAAWWRRWRCRSAGSERLAHARTRRTTRAPTSCTCARTSWPAPTTASRRRATSTSAAWSWTRASRPPGPTSAAATASSASTSTASPDSDDARGGGLPPRPRAQPAALRRAQVLRAPRGGHGPGAARARAPAGRGRAATATIPSCSRGSSTPAATAASSSSPIAAHEEARRLDPNVPTSYEQTLLMTGDIERAAGHPSRR